MNNFIDIDFEMIGEKYPKSLEKFLKYGNCPSWSEAGRPIKNIFYDVFGFREYQDFCYCDFVEFFDNNGIIIQLIIERDEYCQNFKKWYIDIFDKENMEILHLSFECYINYFEAQIEGIYKAFEIMEKIN